MRETASLPTCRRRAWRTRNPFGRGAFAVDGPADRHGAGAGSGKSSSTSPGTSHRRNRHSGAARSPAVEPLSHAGGRGARHHLDSRRARGDARRLARGRAEGEPGAAVHQYRRRPRGERLSRRRGVSARCSSAGSPTGSAARSCSSSRSSVYLVATAATALSWNFWSFALFRFLTGAGIGGEYAAINSTIQELIPARVRGWTDLVINGSFWIGAALGALGAIVLLDPARHRSRIRLAAGLPDRRAAGAGDLLPAAVAAGEPALADDARPCRGGRAGRRRHRAARVRGQPASRQPRAADGAAAHAQPHAAARRCSRHARSSAPPPRAGRPRADGGAGVLLQRDLLHLRAGADRLLRHPARAMSAGTSCRSRPAISSGRCCSAGCSTRSAAAR